MEQYVGLDVSLKETSLCVVDQTGTTLWQGKCASTPESIAAVLARRAPGATRIGLESGLLSTWHWPRAQSAGSAGRLAWMRAMSRQPCRCGSTRRMPMMPKGSPRSCAPAGIARCRSRASTATSSERYWRPAPGWWPCIGTSPTRSAAHSRPLAWCWGRWRPERSKPVSQLIAGNPLLVEVIEALLKVWRTTGEQLVTLHRRVLRLAQTDETCRRLMTVPGVGAVTAAAFLATVDDPERFRRSSSVGAYLGLTPRRCQSGDIDYTGRISKRGDGLMRTYLFEAAHVLLTRVSTWSTSKAWGMRLAKRSGVTRAQVALARKLAVILHRLWRDGTSFRWSTQEVSG